MTRRMAAGVLAVAALLVFGCAREPVRILFIGDSITFGRIVSEPAGPPFAALLADELGEDFEVVNLGCGGSSTRDWTRSRGTGLCGGRYVAPNLYEGLVLHELPADLAVVMLGTNDAFGAREPSPLSAEGYEANLRELLGNLRQDGVPRVLLVTAPPAYRRMPAARLSLEYGEVVSRLCAAADDVVCGPDVLRLLGPDDFAGKDHHPNGAGHRKIASALLESIRALDP